MDSLYFIGRAQFHQLATHVALYREDSSPAYKQLSVESLQAVGLRPEKFAFWNVPVMSSYLGKAVPLDVHGGHVLIDEDKVMPMATSYGVLRYALLSSAVRAKEGGRWRYDFMTMNTTIGLGVTAGFVALSVGRKRVPWMRRHPIGCIFVALLTCLTTTVVSRQGIKMLGLGIVQAQKSHQKALKALRCTDCLEDVNVYTKGQILELKEQKIPSQPGMPPPPEEYVKRFEKNLQLQVRLLETDVEEVRLIRKHAGGELCVAHKGLRSNPRGYQEQHGLTLLNSDRDRAAAREAETAPTLDLAGGDKD